MNWNESGNVDAGRIVAVTRRTLMGLGASLVLTATLIALVHPSSLMIVNVPYAGSQDIICMVLASLGAITTLFGYALSR